MRLKYWIKLGIGSCCSIAGASALFSFLMFLQTDSGWNGLLVLLPLYLTLFGGLLMITGGIGLYRMNVPLAISFGSTRNEALLGLQLFRIFPIVLIPVLAALLTALSPEPAQLPPAAMFSLGIGVFLITNAVGVIIGVVYTKYGKLATILTAVSLMLVGFGAGFLAVFADSLKSSALFSSNKVPALVLAVGLFLYAISMIPEHRIVWKCNVKL